MIAAAAALGLAGCGGGSSTTSGSMTTAGKPVTTAAPPPGGSSTAVRIKNFAYAPATLTVKSGASVTFTNSDGTNHTATATGGGAFDTGTIAPGASKTVSLNTPGTFAYVCNFHPFMHGTIRVTG
jgi:plastocyanin